MKLKPETGLCMGIAGASVPKLFQSATVPEGHSSTLSQFHGATDPEGHSFREPQFQRLTSCWHGCLPCIHPDLVLEESALSRMLRSGVSPLSAVVCGQCLRPLFSQRVL